MGGAGPVLRWSPRAIISRGGGAYSYAGTGYANHHLKQRDELPQWDDPEVLSTAPLNPARVVGNIRLVEFSKG
jgi:hypothetical protein